MIAKRSRPLTARGIRNRAVQIRAASIAIERAVIGVVVRHRSDRIGRPALPWLIVRHVLARDIANAAANLLDELSRQR